jgi:hypothetical protein
MTLSQPSQRDARFEAHDGVEEYFCGDAVNSKDTLAQANQVSLNQGRESADEWCRQACDGEGEANKERNDRDFGAKATRGAALDLQDSPLPDADHSRLSQANCTDCCEFWRGP